MSLAARFLERLAAEPERVCLEGDGGRHTRGDVRSRALRVAAALEAQGIRPGDRVALSLAKNEWLPACHVAVLARGAVVVPLNPALPDAELASLVERSGARIAISGGALAARARAIAPAQPWWCAGDPAPSGTRALEPSAAEAPDAVPRDPDQLALLAFTSGTTGRPKGVPLSHGNLAANLDALALAWEWSPEDRLLHVLPVFHLHGLGVALYGSLWVGNAVLFHERFEAARVLREAPALRPTLLMAVPTMLHRLVDAAGPEDARALESVRLVVSGSAPLSPALFARFRDRFGLAPLERYGLSETVMNTSNPVHGPRKAGSVGLPLRGVAVELRDPETGAAAGRGPGEVCVRGPNVFAGYWRDDAATRAAFHAGGWFRTGDLGTLDAEGALRIVGRVKEIIVTGGYNVSPAAVEQALSAEDDPEIAELAVGAVPDDDLGERVTAFVVAAQGGEDGASAPAPDAWNALCARLEARAAEHLPRYARPRAYVPVPAIPRNALGKVQRGRLAPLAAASSPERDPSPPPSAPGR